MARLRRAGCEAAGLEGVSPALRAWASNFSLRSQRKVTNRAATPAYSPDLRRVPSAHPLVRRHAPTGHPWPGAARSTSCLAAWTSVLASANKRGNQSVPLQNHFRLFHNSLRVSTRCSMLIKCSPSPNETAICKLLDELWFGQKSGEPIGLSCAVRLI